jgi:sulfite reductase (NADPH) flavoprotein alpha-component
MNIVPETAPFSREQRAWLNGFLAASLFDRLGSVAPASAPSGSPPVARPRPLWIGVGSQSGSASGLAKKVAKAAESKGFEVTLRELDRITPDELSGLERLLVVCSTWGDGEPPDNAAGFWSRLSDGAASRLESLRYSVLGLGDRNYADFCGAARRIDERLEALGARRVAPRAECDGGDRAPFTAWMEAVWPSLDRVEPEGAPPSVASPIPGPDPVPGSGPSAATPATACPWTRRHPYPARLRVARRLNGEGSSKDTRHIEIELGDSSLAYEAGDALGVQPSNDPALVEGILQALGLDPGVPVSLGPSVPGGSIDLGEALANRWVLTQPSPALVKRLAELAPGSLIASLSDPSRRPDLESWMAGRDVLDALRSAPEARLDATELGSLLRPLQPRLYSIASSPKAHPGEVHLTVGTVRYEAHGRSRLGVASCWLADRVVPGVTPVPVFVQVSRHFRPPSDPSRPMIMVGPGTGIAPFRAFLQERRATGATGKNWLFFGDQRRATDYLYSSELDPLHRDGFLTRLDLAFSRDQESKVYVQDRMREQFGALWQWLEEGAHFYVCGDARRMAKDVEAALRTVIQTAGGRTEEQASEYLESLRSEGRYQKDVY